MRNKLAIFFILSVSVFLVSGGCAHNVSDTYPEYVEKHEGDTPLPSDRSSYPTIEREASYKLTEATQDHSYRFRSWASGVANSWVVKFGPMLKAHLESKDIQEAFTRIDQSTKEMVDEDIFIVFDLKKYKVSDLNAHIDMKITAYDDGKKIIDKTYSADGKGQFGKVTWGGAFAMQNAIHQSTLYAVNEILFSFLKDLKPSP